MAKKLRVSPQMVGRWRARFVTRRVDGLLDEPRPGAPRTITDDTVEAVIVRTLETTPDGATHWSTRTLAKATGLSHGTIARIWRAFGLQPHRTKTFTLRHRGHRQLRGGTRAGVSSLGHPAGWPVGARRVTSVYVFKQSGEA